MSLSTVKVQLDSYHVRLLCPSNGSSSIYSLSSGVHPSLEINLGKALMTAATLGIVVFESKREEPF